jgi:uncharacterized protein YukJ
MPIKSYAALKCRPLEGLAGSTENPHYQIHGVAKHDIHYRIAVNIRSQAAPPDLLYYCSENYRHPVIAKIFSLEDGLTSLLNEPDSASLDYIRGNLFDCREMRVLPTDLPGAGNDLNEKISKYVHWALNMNDASIYAFGAAWGPEEVTDQYFGFEPGRGIHDIHMNQGNSGKWASDNGPWQDGGLFFHFPALNQWVALFLAFQSQKFHTADSTGAPIDHNGISSEAEYTVRIVAAQVNPAEKSREIITLVNTTNHRIDITDWAIADSQKAKRLLYGEIRPGEFLNIPLTGKTARLSKLGGIITLLDRNGVKVDGVSYTEKDCQKTDSILIF